MLSHLNMFLVVHRSQSPCARSLQSKKWMTTHGLAFHTLNILVTLYQHKIKRERAASMYLELEPSEAIGLVKALLCIVLLLRSLANTVCYFERLPPTSWPTKATFRRQCDVTLCHSMSHCEIRRCRHVPICACHVSFRFWRWRMAVSFRWATLWPRSPWRCHGPQTSCKAFLALTDSLRPRKRKELLQKRKTQKDNQKKRESRILNEI